jgi:hypothetical protein
MQVGLVYQGVSHTALPLLGSADAFSMVFCTVLMCFTCASAMTNCSLIRQRAIKPRNNVVCIDCLMG